jgi:hypothetical protein
MPREVHDAPMIDVSNGGITVVCSRCNAEDNFAAKDLKDDLAGRGVPVTSINATRITLLRASSVEAKQLLSRNKVEWAPELDAEGYVIVSQGKGIAVIGSTASGVFYGAQTAKQLVDTSVKPTVLHPATIRDWPAMKVRGLDDDLSRGPFPTLEFQKKQIRTIAAYKVNMYSPYFEHTFQYTSQPVAAPPGGSLSQAEAKELVAYAAKYHIVIVPEQEAFGHLHYILNWELYATLAETPHGNVLAPGQPGSLALTKQMFTELASVFPSPYLHLGADETGDLGKGQTKADVDKRGLGAAYLDYMQRIVADLKPLNRKLLFWGDIAMHDPELVKALPRDFKDATIALAWEYNPQPKGFGPWIKPYTDAGMECWVSPGINNWSRVFPNNNLAEANIQQFTAEGQKDGCTGQLNTIWNDDGETLANADWFGILFGAAAAWQQGEASIPQFEGSYGHVFHNDSTGKVDAALLELKQAHAMLRNDAKISDANDALFWMDPWAPENQKTAGSIRPYLSQLRIHAENAIVLVAQARAYGNLREQDALDMIDLGARKMDLIGLKFQLTDEMTAAYAKTAASTKSGTKLSPAEARNAGRDVSSLSGKMQDIRYTYVQLRQMHHDAWLKSYRPYWLQNNLEHYDNIIQMWYARADKLRAVQRQWMTDQTLPPASTLGLPEPSTTVSAAH